jgi:hypothetical protein
VSWARIQAKNAVYDESKRLPIRPGDFVVLFDGSWAEVISVDGLTVVFRDPCSTWGAGRHDLTGVFRAPAQD